MLVNVSVPRWLKCTGLFLVYVVSTVIYLRMSGSYINSIEIGIKEKKLCPLVSAKSTLSGVENIDAPVSSSSTLVNSNKRQPSLFATQHEGSPVTKIAFLKVHKTGSSTIQNILFRFGMKMNLTFVLPLSSHYIKSRNGIMPVKPGRSHDIFACHTIYRPNRFNILPHGYKTLAIVREPLKRMISAAYYYRDEIKKKYLLNVKRESLVNDLINHFDVYEKGMFSRTRNSMGYDFGFDKIVKHGETAMQQHFDHIKTKFDLVLVMELFDESLVLLKRKFNWSFRDIIYMKSNSHTHPMVNLTSIEIQKFKKVSYLDYKIYDMFKVRFDDEVRELGPAFKREVHQFKRIIHDINIFCMNSSEKDDLEIEETVWNKRFGLTYNDCSVMKKKEIQFVSELKYRHRKMNNLPLPPKRGSRNST